MYFCTRLTSSTQLILNPSKWSESTAMTPPGRVGTGGIVGIGDGLFPFPQATVNMMMVATPIWNMVVKRDFTNIGPPDGLWVNAEVVQDSVQFDVDSIESPVHLTLHFSEPTVHFRRESIDGGIYVTLQSINRAVQLGRCDWWFAIGLFGHRLPRDRIQFRS